MCCYFGLPSCHPLHPMNMYFSIRLCYPRLHTKWGFPGGSAVKNLPEMQETWVQPLGREAHLEEGMATHSSTLA